jgi:multiple sugar transport system permease protein
MRGVSNGILILIGLCFALPLLWLLLASFDSAATLTLKWPEHWTLHNFGTVLTPTLTFVPLLNSLILSFGCAIVTVIVAVLAAYPLSRYKMRVNKPFLYGILFGTGLPITAMMVPVYSLFVAFNLIDSMPGIILFMSATSLPIAIWMMKNFMDSVPIVLEEAAWVDGASMLATLTRVVVPLMRPGIAVCSSSSSSERGETSSCRSCCCSRRSCNPPRSASSPFSVNTERWSTASSRPSH